MTFLIEVTIDIKGWNGDRCPVQYLVADGNWFMRCMFQPDTLALLTDEKAYSEARAMDAGTGNLTFDADSDRDNALSAAMDRDCQTNDAIFPQEELSPDPAEEAAIPIRRAYN